MGDAKVRTQTELAVKALPVAYKQGSLPLCVLYSLMSALHLYGDVQACGALATLHQGILDGGTMQDRDQGASPFVMLQALASHVPQTTLYVGFKWDPRLTMLCNFIRSATQCHWDIKPLKDSMTLFSTEKRATICMSQALSHLLNSSDEILLVQLWGRDGSTTHAVALVQAPQHPSTQVCAFAANLPTLGLTDQHHHLRLSTLRRVGNYCPAT